MRDMNNALKSRIFTVLAVLILAACGAGQATKSTDRPTDAAVRKTPESASPAQRMAKANQLVAEKNWPEAIRALRAIIDSNSFGSLPSDVRYQTLMTAGRVSLYHGPPKVAYEYLVRVTTLPQANFDDWQRRLQAAKKMGNVADSVGTLTVLMQRWPDQSRKFNPDYVRQVIGEAKRLPRDAELPLLKALYDAQWKLPWDIEPSATWRDLVLLLLDRDRFTEANEVARHVTDVYDLISMRADRRFDRVVANNPAQFEIEQAADREFQFFQAAAEKAPQSLELKSHVIEALLSRQRYEAALAASDSILFDIQSTNYPEKLYEDFGDAESWFLNLRAIALERVGHWDEAVAQLTAASQLHEKYSGNVDQLINLADLYCALGRPDDALSAIRRMVAGTGRYGTMQLESVRLDAAVQLADARQVSRSLHYLRSYRADAPSTYEYALLVVNQPARAATELVRQLLDKDQRQEALLSVQGFAPTPMSPREMELEARWRAVIHTPEVRAAIDNVGRAESYPVEDRF
jgi:tetratricopeptide (TPR) repeat protein